MTLKEYADFAHHYYNNLDDAWDQFKLFRRAFDIDKKLKKVTPIVTRQLSGNNITENRIPTAIIRREPKRTY